MTPPNTTSWELSSSSSRYYSSTVHAVSAKPPPLPEAHVSGTPVTVQRDTLLPISYEALTAQEHLSGALLHDVSAVRTEVDNVHAELVQLMTAGGEAISSELAVKRAKNLLSTLMATLSRSTYTAVDTLQAASYHRRWALTTGANNVERNTLLRAPLVGTSNALGLSDLKCDVKVEAEVTTSGGTGTKAPWDGEEIVIDDDDDDVITGEKVKTHMNNSPASSRCTDFSIVSQGSTPSLFDEISISNMSPLSETKLIQNLSEFLTFE